LEVLQPMIVDKARCHDQLRYEETMMGACWVGGV
jgi:hypothetical protein